MSPQNRPPMTDATATGLPAGAAVAGQASGATVPSTPALQVRALRVARGGRPVIPALDLTLPAGQWTAIVGPNGAGKTSLLLALAGLVPAAGEVRWLGQDPRALGARGRGRMLAWLGQGEEGDAADLRALDVVMLGRLPPFLASCVEW